VIVIVGELFGPRIYFLVVVHSNICLERVFQQLGGFLPVPKTTAYIQLPNHSKWRPFKPVLLSLHKSTVRPPKRIWHCARTDFELGGRDEWFTGDVVMRYQQTFAIALKWDEKWEDEERLRVLLCSR
jgi:hypothetical protein